MLQEVQITNFTHGELSPRMKGRTDLAAYFNGLDTELNMVSMPLGGAIKRPGTLFVGLAKDQSPTPFRAKSVPFIFSTVQAYQLEFTQGNVRVYMNDAVVLNAGVPVDIAVPYQAADLPALKYTQSADTLYLCHPSYPPAVLTRSSHTSWSYSTLTFLDGPYLPVNTTATTLTPSGTSGSITISASATTGINATASNPGQGFLASDVGRMLRIKVSAAWGWCLITAVNSPTSVTATVQAAVNNGAAGALDGTTATAAWQLGKWSATTGYPYYPSFWQQRLMFGGTNNQPNAIEGSQTGDFYNFAPTAANGTVSSSNALSWIISDDQVNATRWLSAAGSAQAMQLGIGTDGCEDIMQAATTSQALTPTNVQVYRETSYGSAPNVPPLRIGKSVLFADRTGRKIREWTFFWQVNGYLGPDKTQESEHITRGPVGSPPQSWGIRTMAYQQSPHQVVWAARNDGALIGFTYDRDQNVWAPHRHQLGGQYYGGPPLVESLSVIPSPDSTYDELWLIVLRTINGVPTRFVEVMTRYFDALPQDQAFFVDCGLSSQLAFPNATLTPPALANANAGDIAMPAAFGGTGVFTASAAAFTGTSADVGQMIRINGGLAQVTQAVSTTQVTAQVLRPLMSLAPAAANAWSCTPLQTSFSGLTYANGETVAILGDGASFGTQVVAGGAITLPKPGASLVTAGFPYTPVLVTMPWEPLHAAQLLTQGKAKRIDHLYIRFHETLGCDYGRRLTDPVTKTVTDVTDPLQSRSAGDAMGLPPPLFSGIKRVPLRGGFDDEGQIVVTQEEPLPLTVLAISASAEVGEMPAP